MKNDHYFQLAKQVFIEFARFEYCLKISGYLKNNDGPAEPGWDKFSNCCEMKELFENIKYNCAGVCKNMIYLMENPPKRQFAKNGRLSWERAEEIRSSQEYFAAVRRVRNNLFHGGKFNGAFFEPERSERLLQAVLSVLKAARDRHEQVAAAYNDASD